MCVISNGAFVALAAVLTVLPAYADKPSTPVTVINPDTSPVPTTVVNPADIAKALGIQHAVAFELSFFKPNITSAPFNVPASQRLIIEYVSGRCFVSDALVTELRILTVMSSASQSYTVNLAPISSAAITNPTQGNFGHTVKIYVDPASQVFLEAGAAAAGGAGSGYGCNATLSGQLVDVP